MSNIIQFPKMQKSMYQDTASVGAGAMKSTPKIITKLKTLFKKYAPQRYTGKKYATKKEFGHENDYPFMKDYKQKEVKYSKDVDYYLSGNQLRAAKKADDRLQGFRDLNKDRVDLIKQNRRDVGAYNRLVHKMNKREALQGKENLVKDAGVALTIGAISYGVKKHKDVPYRPTKPVKKQKYIPTPFITPFKYQEED